MTSSAANCIFECRDDYGYIWSYTHTADKPNDTLKAALAMAMNVAAHLAVKEGISYVVASTTAPSVTVFILPFGHPMIVQRSLSVISCRARPEAGPPDQGELPTGGKSA